MKPTPLIDFINVHKTYGTGDTAYKALRGISFQIFPGELVAIMGPSGSGKSTLMNLLGFLDTPSQGQYLFRQKPTEGYKDEELTTIRNQEIGFVFQSFNLLPRISVIDNVKRPMIYANIDPRTQQTKAMAQLVKLGLADKAARLPTQISGGQIQRVAIARALVMDPGLILADEPTGNLDTASATIVMDELIKAHKIGHTVILVTHSPEIAAFANRIIVIRDGLIESDQPVKKGSHHV